MKLQLHENGQVEFHCDCCDRILDDADPGEVYFPNNGWFIDHVADAGPDDCWFLCSKCFADHRGEDQPWYDDRWKSLERNQDRS